MATICLYQDSRHEAPLLWMQNELGCGYVSKRNDGMTELRIQGYSQVRETLETLLPYLRFKKIQARALLQACKMLEKNTIRTLTPKSMRTIVDLILLIQSENYMSKGRKTKDGNTVGSRSSSTKEIEILSQLLGLTP